MLPVDLVGLLTPNEEVYNYILTTFDPFSHCLVAVPVSDKRAVTIFNAFVRHIVLEGRLPARLVLQNGHHSRAELLRPIMGQNFTIVCLKNSRGCLEPLPAPSALPPHYYQLSPFQFTGRGSQQFTGQPPMRSRGD